MNIESKRLFLTMLIFIFISVAGLAVTVKIVYKQEASINILKIKLQAYRVVNNRNAVTLNKNEEMDLIYEICKDYQQMIIFLWAQRRLENGMPFHNFGCKRHFGIAGKDEQLECAKIILIQELVKFALLKKNKNKFIYQWGKRINADKPEQWIKNAKSIIKDFEKEWKKK